MSHGRVFRRVQSGAGVLAIEVVDTSRHDLAVDVLGARFVSKGLVCAACPVAAATSRIGTRIEGLELAPVADGSRVVLFCIGLPAVIPKLGGAVSLISLESEEAAHQRNRLVKCVVLVTDLGEE